MWFSILSGIVAFVLWCVTDTSLDPNHFRNSKGEITFWRNYLPRYRSNLSLDDCRPLRCLDRPAPAGLLSRRMASSYRAFLFAIPAMVSLLMILQYVWTIVRPTLNTASLVVMAKFGSQWAKQALDSEPAVSIFWIWN